MKRTTRNQIVIFALWVGAGLFFVFFIFSEAAPPDAFEKITNGMTKSEVSALLKIIPRMRHDPSGETTFGYGGFLYGKWCTMEVFFGADGRVTGKFHDH